MSHHPDDYESGRTDRDRDRDYDRGPRRPRRDDRPYAPPQEPSVLGILSLVQGIGSLIASFIPCVGALAILGGAVGLLFGVIGYFVAKGSARQSTGMPIAGSVINLCAILIGGAWVLLMATVFQDRGGPPVDPGPGIEITAVALDTEYDTNELDADTKYKGKALVVTGRVEKITRDDKPGKITVKLAGTAGSAVDCHFDRDKQAELDALAVGQDATVRGTCKGKVRSFVTLETCSLDKAPEKTNPKDGPPAPPVSVTAEELERAYGRNVVAADAKYKDKVLELTGQVFRVVRNKPGVATVEFETEAGVTIGCDFPKNAQGPLEAVAPGDTIVVRGTCRGRPDDAVTLGNCTFVGKPDKPVPGTPIKITAEELAKAHTENVVTAEKEYKGKLLEVTGKVVRVAKNRPGKITVFLGSDEGGALGCDFLAKDAQTQLDAVEAGATVVIRGTCRGGDGFVTLENCSLVKK